MKHLLLVNCSLRETRVAVLEDGVLDEFLSERQSLVGNVYQGKISRILPDLQSAFIDVGLEHSGFLSASEMTFLRGSLCEDTSNRIERLLHEGQYLMVQVVKDPIGTKGTRLTTEISIAGRSLVYLPSGSGVHVSKRIEGDDRRRALRRRVLALRPKGDKGGYIIRGAVQTESSSEVFRDDMDCLKRTWSQIQRKAQEAKKPSLLYKEPSLVERFLRDRFSPSTTEVWVDDLQTFERLQQFAKQFVPAATDRIRLYEGNIPLFEHYGVEREIERALARRVDLACGGYLVIDQTEALTTVDVNTGSCIEEKGGVGAVLQTNLEAAEEVARQLRIRNLGGMIIVDFVNMSSTEHQTAVLQALKKAVVFDPVHVTVSGFNELGLVALTRKRTRESLSQVLCEPCPLCGGRGVIKTARTVCYEVMRKVTMLAKTHEKCQALRVIASPSVVAMLQGEEAPALKLLESALDCRVQLDERQNFTQEQWDVVLA